MSVFPISRRPILAACAFGLGAIVFALALAGNAFAHGVTFKLQHSQAPGSALNQTFITPWAQKIHDESGGRISLLTMPAGEADGAVDLFQIALDRAADIVWLDLPASSGDFPRFGIFSASLPGITSAGSSQALWAWSDSNDLGSREFRELRILAASRHDAPLFHMRQHPIASLSELKGLKIAIPNTDGEDFLAALGASPLVATGSQMRKALADGTVDGVLLSWSSLTTLELAQFVKMHAAAPTGAPWAYGEVSALLMNSDAYRSLADDLKQVIRANSGNDVSAWIGKVFDESAAKARQAAAEHGDVLRSLPASDLAAWTEAATTALKQRVKALDDRKLRGEKMVIKVRALINEYDAPR